MLPIQKPLGGGRSLRGTCDALPTLYNPQNQDTFQNCKLDKVRPGAGTFGEIPEFLKILICGDGGGVVLDRRTMSRREPDRAKPSGARRFGWPKGIVVQALPT